MAVTDNIGNEYIQFEFIRLLLPNKFSYGTVPHLFHLQFLLLHSILVLKEASSLWPLFSCEKNLQWVLYPHDQQYIFHGKPVVRFISLFPPWLVEVHFSPNWLDCWFVRVNQLIYCCIVCICWTNCVIIGFLLFSVAPNMC